MFVNGSQSPSDWRGIWGFPLTPFASRGVDLELLARGTEHQLSGGVDVLCACGVIAQLEQLERSEHRACVHVVVEAAAGRVPVLSTVLDGCDAPSVAAAAVQEGAVGLLVIPSSPDPKTVQHSLRAIADATPGVPQALYHRPPLRLEVDDLRRLAETAELTWIKDGHRDVRLFRRLRAAEQRLLWVSAWEDVALAFWALGCAAFAPASTAYAPEYAVAWLGRLRNGDLNGAAALLEAHAYPMVDLRLSRSSIDISVIKTAMEQCGVAPGLTRPPALALSEHERETVCGLVREMRAALQTCSAA